MDARDAREQATEGGAGLKHGAAKADANDVRTPGRWIEQSTSSQRTRQTAADLLPSVTLTKGGGTTTQRTHPLNILVRPCPAH